MSKLANALEKLNSLYAQKKGKVEEDTIKQVENQEALAQKKPQQE